MVSQRLRQLRRSRGFTLDQLSEVSGVNRGTIHRIELDQVSPRLDTLELLCRALGTDLPGFFGQGGTENGLAAPGVDEAPVAGPARDFRQGVLDWLGHLEALFHHSADGFAVTDPGGYISFESQVAMRLRGDTPAGRSGRPWYHTAHPEDQPALVAGMAAVLQRPGETLRLEYRAPVGDGRWRWIRATLRNQVDHPAIRGIVLNLQDITDWKATEAQRWRIQKLESQLQVVKAMTAEFSNLWMGLQGHLDVVRLEGGDANGMAGLQSSLDRASRMIHQMRDICGHLAFDLKPVDFNGIVREQAAARAAQPGAGLRVDLDLHPELPALNGDRELLARMIGHLFDHLAATREGAAGRIRLSTTSLQLSPQEVAERFRDQDLERGGTFAVLEIHDPQPPQPAGPDQDPLDHLFAAGVADGMLTLSAAMRTVRDHGGALEEIRHPENGTILRVYFPVPSTTDLGPLAAGPARSGPILVVDDEEFILSAICDMLEALGHRTLAARNGQEALDLHATTGGAIRLVLLDVNMPVLGGEAVYRELRRRDPELRVVLCTGAAALPPDHAQRYHGVAGILRKPFRYEDLRRLIQTVLD